MNAIKSIAETKLIRILVNQEAKTPAIVSVLAGGIAGAIEAASTVSYHHPSAKMTTNLM